MTNTTGPAQQRDQPTKTADADELQRLIDAYGVATRATVRNLHGVKVSAEESDADYATERAAYLALMQWIARHRGGVLR